MNLRLSAMLSHCLPPTVKGNTQFWPLVVGQVWVWLPPLVAWQGRDTRGTWPLTSHAPSHLEVWTAGVVGAADAVAVVEGVVRVPGALDCLQLVVVRPVPHPPV